MGRVIEIDITPEIPWAETAKALDWCKRFDRSWQDAKRHRQARVAIYRANIIEALEPRVVLSVSGLSIGGIDPPVDNGSSGLSPNATEGLGISPNFTYGTDH